MLPSKLRFWLFDRLSVKTMRYVSAVPWAQATGLVREVYEMIADDFFMNGSLTSRSRVPNLMAAIWSMGRESMLVDDQIDRTTKEAICAVLSDLNDCPYCGDMLVSL
ncbi:MAG: carboxymuconolactone decarboxylase family protein, partial [Planctomycetota bacterium]